MANNYTLMEIEELYFNGKQTIITDYLDKCSKLYYDGKESPLDDTSFDHALKLLQKLEKETGYVYPNSPTLRVGSDIQKEFKKGKHPYPMLTIENTYNDEELLEWSNKLLSKYPDTKYNVSVKYDGISCELHYHWGRYVKALTRGDKVVGDDITENVRGINDVPMQVPELDFVENFYVRGEVLMPKSSLAKLNEENEKQGIKKFANTRNACSGSLKQLDPKITWSRGLIFRPWDCFYGKTSDGRRCGIISGMEEKTNILKKYGFVYEENSEPITVNSQELLEKVQEFKTNIDSLGLDYEYDGVVIKINDCNTQEEIGTKDTRAIEWGIARKWNEEYVVKTDLVGVDWECGRTGVITPVGRLEPVECNGVIINNVTLNNVDFIKNLGLKLYQTLIITRSGGVIPYVLGREYDIPMEINRVYPEIKIPTVCPTCGKPLVMEGKLLKCVNPNCKAKVEGRILQFCSKDCCDIKTIGESVVHDLVETGLVTSIIDILKIGAMISDDKLREEIKNQWITTLGEGYGEKSVNNMLDAIEYARINTPYDRLLGSLSIPNIGKTMARTLAKKYKDVYKLMYCTVDDLKTIEGIADTTAQGIFDWINKFEGNKILTTIDDYGWNSGTFEEAKAQEENKPLDGLNLCFSGSSSRFSGDAVEEFLESLGAKCGHSISKKTSYLIVGTKPGQSKVQKATELGVEIIEENEFYKNFGL